jgi:dihydropyrimidinase
MFDLVIRSARIVTPVGVVMGDLAIKGEKIAAIGQGLGEGRREVDCVGRVIFPGIVDAHVHMGVPAGKIRSADDLESGTLAAVFGGVTTVIDFTEQRTGEKLVDSFERRLRGIEGNSYADVALHCNITSFSAKDLEHLPELVARGVRSFKVFTAYKSAGMQLDDGEFLQVAEAVADTGGLLMVHAENGDAVEFMRRRLERDGKTAAKYHEVSRPDLLEAEAIHRVATLTRLAGCKLYVVHVSSRRGLDVIRRFRNEGWTIYTETCPQYLLLDKGCYEREQGHRYIASPPLREAEDCTELTRAVNEGEIEVIGSDHCPFTIEQRDAGGGKFTETPGGLPGVETLFSLAFSRLVALGDGGLTPRSNASLVHMARLLAENPARIFGLAPAKGALKKGADADFIVFDPNPIRRLRAQDLHGAADWNPYEGIEVRGEIRSVYLRGQRVVENGQLHGEKGFGRFVVGAVDETANDI